MEKTRGDYEKRWCCVVCGDTKHLAPQSSYTGWDDYFYNKADIQRYVCPKCGSMKWRESIGRPVYEKQETGWEEKK